ncbi:MAG TPA: MFS transporter, partial [Gaiellaceae bacterium]|nr:MFS transporter [Gaiellaceae bacterium]
RVDRAALRALGLLAAALVLSMTTWFSATAVVPQLREEWELGNTAAAWLTIAVQVGFVAGALAGSALSVADVLQPRVVILVGSLGAAAANLVLVVADGPLLGIGARLATGFFLAGVYPPALKLASTWFRRGRGTALGIVVGALTLGSAGPHLVNGLGGLDWRLVVWVTSALTAAGGLVVYLRVPEGPFSFPSARFDPRQAGLVLRNRGVRLASLGYFGHMWELYAMWAWFLVFFAAVAADGRAAAYATFAVIGAGAAGCWFGGVLGDRWGRPETTAAMMAVSASCAALIGLAADAPAAIVLGLGLVWGFTVVADSAQFSTLVTELAEQAYVGTALGLQMAVGFALTVPTIWLLPFLEEEVGWRWAFAFLAPGPALGIVAMLRLRRLEPGVP